MLQNEEFEGASFLPEWGLAQFDKAGVLWCRRKAKNTVEVSDDVNELIIGVRTYLQETCEPPCYVSDRRLLKAVDMLKVGVCRSAPQKSTKSCLGSVFA